MNCREFTKKVEGLTLAEISRIADEQAFSHQHECVTCASWFQHRQRLAGAMQDLRNSTATLEAPVHVEQEVLRVFRRSAPAASVIERKTMPPPFAFRLSRFFEWGAYAAVAAALAISLGLGFWFWQHSGKTAADTAQQKAPTQQSVQPEIAQPEKVAQAQEVKPSTPATKEARTAQASTALAQSAAKNPSTAAVTTPTVSGQSLAQAAQAQGYTPMMLCDPLSCSGDEQVVRMEFPANGSQGTQMADVVLGDDGLVRAIRIVQQ